MARGTQVDGRTRTMHGGNAEERLLRKTLVDARRLVPIAIRRLGKILDDDEAPSASHISAANAIFDRALGKPKATVEGRHTHTVEIGEAYIDALRAVNKRAEVREAREALAAQKQLEHQAKAGKKTVELNGEVIEVDVSDGSDADDDA